MRQTLRKADGSLFMTVPKAFIDQNGLTEGSQVEVHLQGQKMTVEVPTRPRYKLADLMAEMPEGLPRVEGWDATPSISMENNWQPPGYKILPVLMYPTGTHKLGEKHASSPAAAAALVCIDERW